MSTENQKSSSSWTFLSNYAHVLICLHRNPEMRLRDVADLVGITERAVQKIIKDLEESDVINKKKEGRRNIYSINKKEKMRHPLESHCSVMNLLQALE
jgi:DNA-binding MarR family transcriptional regulator